jgi:cytochrome P450
VQTLAWFTRPLAYLEQCRARYGKRFTLRFFGQPTSVMVSDPEDLRQIFTAPVDVLHPGEGARILEPVVGLNSVILLDGRDHLRQRKLMLPAFHGERMQELAGLMEEVAEREVAEWPRDRAAPLHPRFQALTLEVILRAVFGLDPGERLDAMRSKLTAMAALGTSPGAMLPFLQRALPIGPPTPWTRFVALRSEVDGLIFDLIDERRRDPAGESRGDILTMLLAAEHEDGSPMSPQELRDELMTLLVAGHETTASALAWAFARLPRHPEVLERLTEEIAAGDDDAYLTATIQETLRRRPVLPNAAPRLVKEPVEIGGWEYPAGVSVVPNAYLVQHDPDIYPEPYAFRPERFLDKGPGTYTWIPFGGGRRRCLGASFAMLEMKIVMRAVIAQTELSGAAAGYERSRRRSITISPGQGAPAVLRDRARTAGAEPELTYG